MSIYDRLGVRRVINTRGPATVLGASRVAERIRKDIYDVLDCSLDMYELQGRASEAIANLTGAEAGCVTGCTAAGIAVAVAATLTGDNVARIKSLPNIEGSKRNVVIQKGHVTGAGDAPITQVIRMTGAEAIEIGEALDCATFHLRHALDDETVSAVFVMGGAFPPNLLPLETFIGMCKEKSVPVIVDAAYETDFTHLIEKGADLVIHSVQKWLGGPTAAIIAGSKELVHSCFLQDMGIGRPMKAGKEGVAGAIFAIEEWQNRDQTAVHRQQRNMAERIRSRLERIKGINCEIRTTPHSPAIRLVLTIDAELTGITAWELNGRLAQGEPPIKTDDYSVNSGLMELDFSYADEGDDEIIAQRIIEIVEEGSAAPSRSDIDTVPLGRQDLLFRAAGTWLDR